MIIINRYYDYIKYIYVCIILCIYNMYILYIICISCLYVCVYVSSMLGRSIESIHIIIIFITKSVFLASVVSFYSHHCPAPTFFLVLLSLFTFSPPLLLPPRLPCSRTIFSRSSLTLTILLENNSNKNQTQTQNVLSEI